MLERAEPIHNPRSPVYGLIVVITPDVETGPSLAACDDRGPILRGTVDVQVLPCGDVLDEPNVLSLVVEAPLSKETRQVGIGERENGYRV